MGVLMEKAAQELRDAKHMLTKAELARFSSLLALRAEAESVSPILEDELRRLVERHPVLEELVPLANGDDEDRKYLVLRVTLLRAAIEIVEAD
jgi:hypothetical protein